MVLNKMKFMHFWSPQGVYGTGNLPRPQKSSLFLKLGPQLLFCSFALSFSLHGGDFLFRNEQIEGEKKKIYIQGQEQEDFL